MAHDHSHRAASRTRLLIVIPIVAVVLVAQLVGGLLTGSLALLADSGHLFSDLTGLVIAVVAIGIASRPATDRHTFGYQRTEILAALANGLILTVVAVSVGIEGVRRLLDPGTTEIAAVPMLIVAVVGLIANVASLLILRGSAKDSLNMRGAYLEVLGDTFGSLGVIVAAVVIALTGFVQADAIASLLIAVAILPRAALLIRDVWRVLNESVPLGTDVEVIRRHIRETDGVVDVHDVHVWAITSGAHVFSAHVVVDATVFSNGATGRLLDDLGECLTEHFDVEHSTFQLEPAAHAAHEERHHR
ncbi:cation diffusion facilitator family transporter [Labedella endophytica]|uniref:Cation transporter n=1 Tax=Labedella endophytica TaxID=1523160 RepID=A0A433JNI9_9MICO|nr:cation diffusion facilitator family transporter [Labedella endophytica]RUQ97659.1 cation transporter [Labedella endophytica]